MLTGLSAQARTLAAICLSGMLWAFSFGVGAPLASVWLHKAGYNDKIVGLNTGVYYLGIALAAAAVPWMMRHWGRNGLAAGMVLSGLSVACFPLGGSLSGYFVLRLLNGLSGAMSLIPLETLVNRNAPPEQRARDFGFYAFSIVLGIALGNGFGMAMETPTAACAAFAAGGLVTCLAGVVVLRWLDWPAVVKENRHERVPLDFRRNFLSFGSAWSQGFLEGAMMALLPLYLLARGLSQAGAGVLMAVTLIGVIIFQVPVAWLADRLGRSMVLLGCYAVTMGALGALCFGLGLFSMSVCLFLAAACSSAFYPLGLAILGERFSIPGLPRASACFLATNCIGSVIGPSLTGVVQDHFGWQAMFLAAIGAVVVIPAACVVLRFHGNPRSSALAREPIPESAEPVPEAPVAYRRAA